MSNHKKQTDASEGVVRQKADNFLSRYANYSYLETSLWDLKIQFGQVDPSLGNTVPIDTAVTLPWPQAKVLAYFLSVHLAAYEALNGRIKIPLGIIPQADESQAFRKLYEEFIAANPEAAPKQDK
jgi:hypothetical protein